MPRFFAIAITSVQTWNAMFGVPKEANANRRLAITGEEVLELCRAQDKTARVDALCDVVWTLIGTAEDFDLDCMPEDRHLTENPVADLGPTLMMLLSTGIVLSTRTDNEADREPLVSQDMLRQCMSFAYQALSREVGVAGAQAAWDEVHRSNFAKLWTEADVAALADAGHPEWVATPTPPGMSDGMFVVRDESGKIRKPPGWVPPNFTAIV